MALSFLLRPWAVTTTCSSISVSGASTTLTVAAAGLVWLTIPMQENTRVLPEGTLRRVYLPEASVMAPLVVPWTKTEAPMTGSPSSADVTVPLTVMFCANAMPMLAHRHNSKENNFLLISLNLN